MGTCFYIEKLTGSKNTMPCKIKMHVILVQQGFTLALEGVDKIPATILEYEKDEMLHKDHSPLIICMGNKPLHEVAKIGKSVHD